MQKRSLKLRLKLNHIWMCEPGTTKLRCCVLWGESGLYNLPTDSSFKTVDLKSHKNSSHLSLTISGSTLKPRLLRVCGVFMVSLMQLGLGHTNHVREPTLVTALQGKNIHQISAGRCHSAAWTAPSVPPRAPGESLKHTPVLQGCWLVKKNTPARSGHNLGSDISVHSFEDKTSSKFI